MVTKAPLLLLIIILLNINSIYSKDDDTFPALKIIPDEVELAAGDSVLLKVLYMVDDSTFIDTSAVWSAEPDTVISINNNGLVIALGRGNGIVTATLDSLSASVIVKVKELSRDGDEKNDYEYELYLSPYDTVITAGAQISYKVFHKSEIGDPGEPVVESITWIMDGMPVGSISSDGVFSADNPGFAIIKAQLADGKQGSAFVIVTGTESDSSVNKIKITKTSNNPDGYSVKANIEEGGIWTIAGLPSPMNILNGGKLYFPSGCLKEDIRIHIDLPKFARIDRDSVDFGKKDIVAGVDFQVFVNDTLSEPYYFQIPLITGLVYKKGLIRKINLDPYSLALYFVSSYEDSLEIDSNGIGYTTIDLERNRIFASVAHFSTLAVMGKTASITGSNNDVMNSPADYILYQNFPNPFNPATIIQYSIPAVAALSNVEGLAQNPAGGQLVTLRVYDVLGRQVATLVNKQQPPGRYNVSWDASDFSSGIYFYKLSAGKYIETKKMLMLK